MLPKRERPSRRALDGETVRGLVVEADDLGTGQARLVSVDAVPLLDTVTNQPDRALLVLRDVTDENRRLDDVEAAHARTERLIADAPHGVAVLDMRGRILQVNSSLAGLTGRTVDALVGRSFDDLAPDSREEIYEHLHRAVAVPGSRVVGEWTIPGPGREDVHVALTSRVISSQDAEDDVILVNVVDLSERRRYEQRLAHLADHDVLTGLPNRRRFDAALAEHLDLCARSGPRGALLLLDLDHFKEVNDTRGHDAGDELIVSTAAVLRGSLRDTDLVARLGGDEFAILLPTPTARAPRRSPTRSSSGCAPTAARSRASTAGSPPASVWSPSPGRTSGPRTCWPWPTCSCTTPRMPGATGSPCSTTARRCSPGPAPGWSGRPGSRRPSRTTTSSSTSSRCCTSTPVGSRAPRP